MQNQTTSGDNLQSHSIADQAASEISLWLLVFLMASGILIAIFSGLTGLKKMLAKLGVKK